MPQASTEADWLNGFVLAKSLLEEASHVWVVYLYMAVVHSGLYPKHPNCWIGFAMGAQAKRSQFLMAASVDTYAMPSLSDVPSDRFMIRYACVPRFSHRSIVPPSLTTCSNHVWEVMVSGRAGIQGWLY